MARKVQTSDKTTLIKINLLYACVFYKKWILISNFAEAGIFFTSCGNLPTMKVINLRRNFITDEGGKGVARVIANNPTLEELDLSFNLYVVICSFNCEQVFFYEKQ